MRAYPRPACVVLLILLGSLPSLPSQAAVVKTPNTTKPRTDPAKQLRADWKMGDLKMTREAVDDATFAPTIKQAAIDAIEWFTDQQEQLITSVQQTPATEAKARAAQSKLQAQYKQKMAIVYDDPKLSAELASRLKALHKELDTMADSADKMFAKLDAVGLTAAQKKKLKPVVQSASDDIKKTVAKSTTGTTADHDVVTKYAAARKKVQQELTPAQREALKKKLAED